MNDEPSRRSVLGSAGAAAGALLAGCAATVPSAAGDWPQPLHDARNTNRTTAAIPEEPTVQWRVPVEGYLGTPVVTDSAVFVAAQGGWSADVPQSSLQARAIDDGSLVWMDQLPEDRTYVGQPAVGEDAVVGWVQESTGWTPLGEGPSYYGLRTLGRTSEQKRWQREADGGGFHLTLHDGTVVPARAVGGEPGAAGDDAWPVSSLSAGTGEVRWREALREWTIDPLATDGDIVVAATVGGTVVALDAQSGERRWRRTADLSSDRFTVVPPALADGTVYVLVSPLQGSSSVVYALDANGGETRWRRPVPGSAAATGSPANCLGVSENRVVVLTEQTEDRETTTRLTGLGRADGAVHWTDSTSALGGSETGELTLTGDAALYCSDDRLRAVSLDGRRRWKRTIEGVSSPKPIVAGGQVYVVGSRTDGAEELIALG